MTDVLNDHTNAPSRRTITTTPTYDQAERVVDWLSDEGFAVERVSIVGTGLHTVEQVGGRLTTASAAWAGARQGAWIGFFLGLLFTLFFDLSTGDFFGVLLYAVVTAALFGAMWGAILHYLQRGKRDFSSVVQTRADRYEVQVDERFADRADSLVRRMPATA
jgi:hypothetical protein